MTNALPTEESLLVELLTEELPPKALPKMGQAFAQGILHVLGQKQLIEPDAKYEVFATPRRLAVLVHEVRAQAPEQQFKERLMPVNVGIDEQNQMTAPLKKRLESKGLAHLTLNDLKREQHGKQEFLFAVGSAAGATLEQSIQEAIEYAVEHLPIPKVMRYQLDDGSSVRFVRPAHGLVALWGPEVLPASVLGLQSGRQTKGHRFMSSGAIELEHAADYERSLLEQGAVVASFEQRKAQIAEQLQTQCQQLQATLGDDAEVEPLLDEVTALVEHPTVYVGRFDPEFLEIPHECLILAMRLHQRYFPLFDPRTNKLTSEFLIVSNMQPEDPTNIIEGNQRVVHPRLADARFFYETDRQTQLQTRVTNLQQSVYHNQLGTQYDRIQRLQRLSGHIADLLDADVTQAKRAAFLAKADLNTLMVGEFPELQGIIGAYYAQAEGESPAVCTALRTQYALRLTEPVDEAHLIAALLFIAERVDTLVGIWGVGLAPTGERDPYALRRAALGLISAYEQLQAGGYFEQHELDIHALLQFAAAGFTPGVLAPETVGEVTRFIYERYRNALISQQIPRSIVEAVLSLQPPLQQVPARISACQQFAQRPEADSLAEVNKRIGNILQRAQVAEPQLDPALLQLPAELGLAQTLQELSPQAQAQFEARDFTGSLSTMAQAKEAVDKFFDEVMVMDEDPALRQNRLALLAELHHSMNLTADISKLAK